MSKHIGSSLRSLYEELGEDADLELLTRKKVLADQVAANMKRLSLTKEALAAAMHTSRTVVYRLLDPTDTGVTIETLSKASRALDVELHISFGRRSRRKRAVARSGSVKSAKASAGRGRPALEARAKA